MVLYSIILQLIVKRVNLFRSLFYHLPVLLGPACWVVVPPRRDEAQRAKKGNLLNVPAEKLSKFLGKIACIGVPPYSPADMIEVLIEDEKVSVGDISMVLGLLPAKRVP